MNDLWPGLDHIANFLNRLDTEGMTVKELRSAIYTECLLPFGYTSNRVFDGVRTLDDKAKADHAARLTKEKV